MKRSGFSKFAIYGISFLAGLILIISLSLPLSAATFDRRVIHDNDDAEENIATGAMFLDNSDLEMIYDPDGVMNQVVGIRFTNITVPKGATITQAYLQFTVDEISTGTVSLVISGQSADNAPTFAGTIYNISSRPETIAQVSWSPADWNTVGEAGLDQRTPEIKTIIQEIVGRPGWVSGNAIAIIISGNNGDRRCALSYLGNSSQAPLLHIEYTIPVTPTPTGRVTVTPTINRITPTPTRRLTVTPTPTGRVTATPTIRRITPTPTRRISITPTIDRITPTPTRRVSITPTPTGRITPTPTRRVSVTPTPTGRTTPTPTRRVSVTPTPTGRTTPTPTRRVSVTPTPTGRTTPTPTSRVSVTPTPTLRVTPTPTGIYQIYYGHLHNHSNVSDGSGTPSEAYAYARDVARLDFFSLADHSDQIDSTEWTNVKNAANAYNQDGAFVTFWGFEWSSWNLGHVAVINSTDYCSAYSSSTDTFPELLSWLSSRDCVAFFNHPGRQDSTGQEFNHFNTTPSDKLVGMELWNKSDAYNVYYYIDGYYPNDGKNHYDEAITRGWKIGAAGSDDNHIASWGTNNDYRVAVWATAKTRTAIYEAFQARRFYSTLDKNLVLSFEINGQPMGARINAGNFTAEISASDGNGEQFIRVELLKNGTVIHTWAPYQSNPTVTQSVTCAPGDYFYVRVMQMDGNEAISSPIFVNP